MAQGHDDLNDQRAFAAIVDDVGGIGAALQLFFQRPDDVVKAVALIIAFALTGATSGGNRWQFAPQVTGRVARPQVITEVTRITPAQHLTQLRQPLLDRVEKAIDKSPF